jgi:hypothetical protein
MVRSCLRHIKRRDLRVRGAGRNAPDFETPAGDLCAGDRDQDAPIPVACEIAPSSAAIHHDEWAIENFGKQRQVLTETTNPAARLVTAIFLGTALAISSVKIVAVVVREIGTIAAF